MQTTRIRLEMSDREFKAFLGDDLAARIQRLVSPQFQEEVEEAEQSKHILKRRQVRNGHRVPGGNDRRGRPWPQAESGARAGAGTAGHGPAPAVPTGAKRQRPA